MTRRSDRPAPGALAAYLEGEVTPSEAAATEAHLRDSGSARRELAQLDELRRTLARWPDDLDEAIVDPAALWQARETPAAARAARPRRWSAPIWAAMGAVAGAAIAAVVLTRGAPPEPTADPSSQPPEPVTIAHPEFRAKAAAATPADDRWVRIEILRVDRDGAARPIDPTGGAAPRPAGRAVGVPTPRDRTSPIDPTGGAAPRPAGRAVGVPTPRDRTSPIDERGALHTGAPLVLRYASGGPDPFGFLMVFAVDAAAQLHWYYPAYEAAGADPRSIAIERDGRARSLPDAIEHDLPAGPLVLYAIFSRAPLRVLDVERAMAEQIARDGWDPEQPARAPLPGAGQHLVRATVVP